MNKQHICLFWLIVLLPSWLLGQTDSTRYTFSLFTDHKSADVGDIITVYIMEFSSGSNQASTTIKNKDQREFELAGDGSMAAALPGMGLGFGKKGQFDGIGKTSQNANLKAKMTARIVERMPDNTLKIEGNREVMMNKDKQVMKLSGFIRQQDVTANNIVYSYNIADAKIHYYGKGAINKGQRPGCIFRVINWFF